MKFHGHVGVIEASDAATLDEALAVARCAGRVLARPQPNLAVLEADDAKLVIATLEERGLHPKVIR